MTSLAAFLQQCLTEEKYGETFISELDQRLETLNYIQLTKMHEVLTNASKAAKMKVWKDGNNEILQHVEIWLKKRKQEHEIKAAHEEEVLRRIRHKEKIRKLNEREKEKVIEQLQDKARKTAELEIKNLEIQRKASYKEQLYNVVEIAEKRRNYHLLGGFLFLLVGCVVIGLVVKPILLVLGMIGGVVLITFFIFYRAYRVSQVAPYDDNPEKIEKQIQQREDELFEESMSILRNNEREYEEKMMLDKLERKKRKKERKHREEILKYLENHPEIHIDPESGDLDQQLQEYLQQQSDQKNRSIEIIHESDDEDEKEEKEEEKSNILSPQVAPGKDFLPIPETNPSPSNPPKTPSASAASSKYLLDENNTREMTFPIIRIQLKLLILTEFINSFRDSGLSDIYLTISLHQDQPSPQQDSLQDTNSSSRIFQTDSQKFVGDVILWRYDSNDPSARASSILSISSLPAGQSLLFEIYSSRLSSITSLAHGLISCNDLLNLNKNKIHKKINKKNIEMIRNDVVKVCNLAIEYLHLEESEIIC